TTGNHVWDQREILGYIEGEPRLIRPANFPDGTPGRGTAMLTGPNGHQVLVTNVMCRLFMDPLDDPFACMDRVLQGIAMPREADFIL
ncbi:YmdB family metallophosphoesterase, partial [Tritonibacter sp. SIMBA_163]|uniref:YmdB family metallophosphoesterase n=1 Tax=Tritonibacter sp. SIMBA_163 TaxID=3080868 RepID=UPI0039815688